MSEFYYRAKSWDRKRRFVAVRKFKGMLETDSFFPVRDYSYFCYVTNIEESPLQLHRLYGDRGESEKWFIQLAGKFTSSGRVRNLKMYSSYYYKSWWSEIDEKIDAIAFA